MNYQGLIPGRSFPVDRELTDAELQHRLPFSADGDVRPMPELSVIHLNSTHLEIVDRYYSWKGYVTFWTIVMTLICCTGVFVCLSFAWPPIFHGAQGKIALPLILAFLCCVAGAGLIFVAKFDWGLYTHYPTILNRRSQEIYVFRKDGSVLCKPWKDIFFTLGRDNDDWGLRGHVLHEDGRVKETFSFGTVNASNNSEGLKALRSHWEFFRRYMEEGPEPVARYVKQALPIDRRKDSFYFGYQVAASNMRLGDSDLAAFIFLLTWPLVAVTTLGRWVAMRLSKTPRWPAEIEAKCRVDADDPYQIDYRVNPRHLR